jgi:hypothetical protein
MLSQHNEPAAPEAPRRRFRKLRISWSVGWGLACLLLVVLWAVSYDTHATTDPYPITSTNDIAVEFFRGRIAAILGPTLPPNTLPLFLLDYPKQNGNRLPGVAGFAMLSVPKLGSVLMVPTWFAVLFGFSAGAAPWMRSRFSLRTLLIASTLIAVVLGLIIYAARG